MSEDDTENGSDDMPSEPEPAPATGGGDDMLEDMFDLTGNKTNMNTELMAGLTSFLATCYIIFVNPAILGEAFANYGIDNTNALVTATILVSAFSSIAMGIYAKNPIVLAPGMGLNAFFTYTVTSPFGMGIHPYVALGAVFWSGVIFVLLSVFEIRTEIMRAIPVQLRYGVAVGIGLFLALLGFADHSNFIQHTPDIYGGVPIVVLGNMFPVTAGMAYAEKLKGNEVVAVIFVGSRKDLQPLQSSDRRRSESLVARYHI